MIDSILQEYAAWICVLSQRTQEIYTGNIRTFVGFTGKSRIKNISMDDVSNFIRSLQKQALSNATIYNYLSSIRSFMKFSTETGHCAFPYKLIRSPKVTETQKEYLTREEYELIDEYLDIDNFHHIRKRLIFRLLWDTGARLGEILALNLEDIDMENQHVVITRQKNLKKSIISWSDGTHVLLIKYLALHLSICGAEALFVSDNQCFSHTTNSSDYSTMDQGND